MRARVCVRVSYVNIVYDNIRLGRRDDDTFLARFLKCDCSRGGAFA